MKIQILEHEFDIEVDDSFAWTAGHMGKASIQKCQILIKEDMSKDAQNSTVMHEIMHMIADMNSLDCSEQTIDNLALGVLSLLKNNQHFISGLWDEDGRLID